MSAGKRIIDGLTEAVHGNFGRVTIEGQAWVRLPEWQPISTAPKDGSHVLAWVYPLATIPAVARFDVDLRRWLHEDPEDFESDDEWHGYLDNVSFEPTHWMPLPPGPRSSAESQK